MITDNHVHVGWFTDGYHSANEVWDDSMAAGVCGMAVSSTSTCAERYKDVLREMRELKRLGGERVRPILWLTPRMLKVKYALPYMLRSGIRWQGVKLHCESHPEWSRNARLLNRGLDVARELGVPVLLHTGDFDSCHAGRFKGVIEGNKDLMFVLAHGRPLEEAIDVMRCCGNAYVDTAFMPKGDIKALVSAGLRDRILFGTDAPINRVYFEEIGTTTYIRNAMNDMREAMGDGADEIFSRCVYHGWGDEATQM